MTGRHPDGAVLTSGDRPGSAAGAAPRGSPPGAHVSRGGDLFTRYARDYVAGRLGRPAAVLLAGCTTTRDLGIMSLRATGADITVSLIDDDHPVTQAAAAALHPLGQAVLGDLRTIPLPPRAFDIVQCALLERIRHAELVLDRLVAATRPGGLLLLRVRDRDSAAAFLDRVTPRALRRVISRGRPPGEQGPRPAIYERLSSVRGVQGYALMRGLVIAERQAVGGLAGDPALGPPGYLAAQRLIAAVTRGRFTAAHEEVLFVLRKPENRFARVL